MSFTVTKTSADNLTTLPNYDVTKRDEIKNSILSFNNVQEKSQMELPKSVQLTDRAMKISLNPNAKKIHFFEILLMKIFTAKNNLLWKLIRFKNKMENIFRFMIVKFSIASIIFYLRNELSFKWFHYGILFIFFFGVRCATANKINGFTNLFIAIACKGIKSVGVSN